MILELHALKLEQLARALARPTGDGWSARPDEARELQALAEQIKQECLR